MKTVKFGVCGLGRIGNIHSKYFSQESDLYELVAGCDREQQRAKQFAEEYHVAGYDCLGDFLKNPDMELAIIATRSVDHVDNATHALAAGKYVLLEKPIAVTNDELQTLRKLDKKYPGKLFFCHNHRFEPHFQNILEIIAGGVLGEVQLVKLCRHHSFRFRSDWQTILSCGGGQLSCWGPHIIDQALQFIHAPVKDVWSNLKRINTPGDADDHVKIMIVGENGIVADLEISDAVALPGAYYTVYGNRGSLLCCDEKFIQLRYLDTEFKLPKITADPNLPPKDTVPCNNKDLPWIEKTVKVTPDTVMWVQVELDIARHLYDAIRKNIPFPIKNEEAFEVVRITEMVKKQNPQFDWL